MATARANITTKVGADTSEFSAAMRRVGVQAQGVAGRIGNSMKGAAASVARLGVAAASAGAAIAGAAASAALFKGVKGAAQIEQMGIAFEVMTGSAEKGKALLEEIRDFGTQTPYEFPALAQGAQTMMAFGVATEQVMPSLRMIGDIAAGDAEKMSSLSLAFGQIASTGRLMGQDLLQLVNAGFNPLQEISAKTGESMAELKKRMEAGLISFDEVVGAFKSATSEGGRFFEMTARQSKTFNGVMSNLSDSVNNALTKMGEPIIQALIPYMSQAADQLARLAPQMESLGAEFAARIPEMITGITSFVDGAYKAFQIFQRIGEAIGAIFGTLGSADYWSGLSDLITSAFMGPLGKLKQGLDAVMSGKSLASAIGSMFSEEADNAFTQAADRLKQSAANRIDPFSDAIAQIMRPLESIKPAVDRLLKPPSAAAETEKKAASEAAKEASVQWGKGISEVANRAMKSVMWGSGSSSIANRIDATGRNSTGLFESRDSLSAGLSRYATIGQTGAFARDRARLGIASGLTTGGLGEKRRVGQGSADKVIRDTRSLQEKQVDHLESMDKTLKQAITVA